MNTAALKSFFIKYRSETIVVTGTFLAACVLYTFSALRFPNDDQFILYRYIDNIVAGNGFVYNIGERVLGSTTPLFTLIVALVKYVFRSVPTPDILAYVNIALLTASSIYFYKVGRHFLSEKFSLIVSVIFMLNLARVVPESMETPLFILTTMAFLHALLSKKYYTSSVWLALMVLTRPDAGLIAVLTAIYWWQKVGFKKMLQLTGVCILIALPWLIFSIWYFGTFIPQSLLTKLHVKDMIYQSRFQAFKVQLSHLSRMYWGKLFDPEFIPAQVLVNLVPFLALVFLAVKKKLNSTTWILFAIPLVYFLSYSFSNPIMFPWYLSQMEPFWILISFIGVVALIEKIGNGNQWKKYAQLAILVLIFAGPVISWAQTVVTKNTGTKTALFEMGHYLKDHAAPGDRVGISNIGIVGYYSNAYILDFIGLVNKDSVSYYPIQNGCIDPGQQYVIPPKLIMDKKPEWIAAGDGEFDRCFATSTWMTSHYAPVFNVGTARVWKLQPEAK